MDCTYESIAYSLIMFVEVFWQQEKLPKLIFLRFTNFNSSNNWSNSCQKRRENWLLFWHWLHITVTSYKTNVFTVYATFIKGNIPIKEMDVRDEKKRQKTYFWRSQLDGRKKRSTTTMDFFDNWFCFCFLFFLSLSKYLKHFPLPFHGGSQCHGAMIEKWIWKIKKTFC